MSFQLRSLLYSRPRSVDFDPWRSVRFVDLSDVDECDNPGVCGTARCENKKGGFGCSCDVGYVYDNETKSCVGKRVDKLSS